jgi:hypothetical protein
MALDFGILQPANISGQLQAGQESAMRNQLAQQQLAAGQQQMETGRMQQEKAGLELQQFKRRQAGLDRWLGEAEKGGQTGDPEQLAESFYKFAREHGDPQLLMSAQQVLMAAKERKQYLSERMPKAPAAGMPNALAPAGSEDRLGDFISQIEAKQSAPMPMPAVTGGALPPAAAPAANMRSPAAPANALAAPVAPANALAAPMGAVDPAVEALQSKIIDLEIRYPSGAAKNEIARLTKQLDEMQKTHVVGRTLVTNTGRKIYDAPESFAPPTSAAEYALAQKDPAFMQFLQDRAAAIRAPIQPVAPTITTVEDPTKPGSFLQVDARTYKGGGAGSPGVVGGARPSATAEKLTLQRAQMGKDLGFAITQLSDITKEGGLIDQSTGSGAGKLVDIGAGFVGKATPGAIAIGKIAPIADLVLKMVPRFEGPQSNADTKSYKEAAGQLADASLPTAIRKEAGKTVLRIMTERKNQFVSSDMAAEGAGAAQIAPPAGFVPDQR